MKLKKVLVILILIVFMTGCTVEYNIDINNESVKEDINIYINESKAEEKKSLNYYLENDITAFNDGNKVYKYKLSKIDSGINLRFEYGNLIGYSASSFFSQCFDKSNISNDGQNVYIKASSFICQSYNYDNVTQAVVNFTTNHEVITHNADKVDNSVYTWYPLNNNKDIILVLKTNDGVLDSEKETIENNNHNGFTNQLNPENKSRPIIIVILLLMAFGSLIGILFLYKIKKSQRS